MQGIVKAVSAKLSTYFEQKVDEAEGNEKNVTQFNRMALSLAEQLHNRLGLNQAEIVIPTLKKDTKGVDLLKAYYTHCEKHIRLFFYEEDEFFNKCPLKPVNKVSSLSKESATVVWKFVRRLYYLAKIYLRNSPIDSIPYSPIIRQFLPPTFDLNKFMVEACTKASKDPKEAIAHILDFIRGALKKTGIDKNSFGGMSSMFLSKNVGQEGQQQLAPLIGMVSESLFSEESAPPPTEKKSA